MLSYSVGFLFAAVLAGVLGFGGVAGTFAWVAKIFFFVFLVLLFANIIKSVFSDKSY